MVTLVVPFPFTKRKLLRYWSYPEIRDVLSEIYESMSCPEMSVMHLLRTISC